MLSVFILSAARPGPLEATMRALVPAAAEGHVADVHVVCDMPEPIARMADAMGAGVVEPNAAQDAMSECRGEWVLILEEGACPTGDWVTAVSSHMLSKREPARFRTESTRSFWQALFGRAKRPLASGLLIETKTARANLHGDDWAGLARGRAVVTLPATLAPANL